MEKIRVLIAEDLYIVREGIAAILSQESDMEVVGKAENGIKAVDLAQQQPPDILILDLVMPQQDGISTIPKIKEVSPDTKILVLTSYAEDEQVFQAIKAGALGYLLKETTPEQLLQAIRDVAHGQVFLPPSIARKLMQEISHPSGPIYTTDPLTRRELETLRLIARGLSNQEIAKELVVHQRTVAKHVSSILNKLHLANRTQAALYAVEKGLTDKQ